MKMKLLLTAITASFLLCSHSFAQEKEKAKNESNMELFSAKTGTLIESSTKEIGKIGGTTIKTSIITNLISNEKVKGLRFEKSSTKQYGSDAINFIDEDEIVGILKSIEIIKSKIIPTTPSNYKEIRFKSRSGFEFGCYWSTDKWSYYLQVDKYKSDSMSFLKTEDLEKFETIIKDGLEKIKTL